MEHFVKNIVNNNSSLLNKLRNKIIVEIDHQGKRQINLSTSKFYKKRRLEQSEIIELVLTSVVAIDKMLRLPECGWSENELRTHLYNGIEYYQHRFEIDLSVDFNYSLLEEDDNIDDLTDRFPTKYKAIDGHRVRSRGELLIDNILFTKGILHAYETRLPGAKKYYCDFYIPPTSLNPYPIYIEYWGIENDDRYAHRRKVKLEIYSKANLRLVELFDSDIDNLYEILTEKLRVFNIELL